MVKIVKNPGNGRLNNLNDPALNVLMYDLCRLKGLSEVLILGGNWFVSRAVSDI